MKQYTYFPKLSIVGGVANAQLGYRSLIGRKGNRDLPTGRMSISDSGGQFRGAVLTSQFVPCRRVYIKPIIGGGDLGVGIIDMGLSK
jgi:hypothetical protein